MLFYHAVNCIFTFFMALLFNILLIVLIAKYTQKEVKKYSQILFLIGIVDIIAATITFICQPVILKIF